MKRNRGRIDEQVTFELSGPDRHFGMDADHATVSMYVEDAAHFDYVGAALLECFGEMWGVEPDLAVYGYKPNERRSHRIGIVRFEVFTPLTVEGTTPVHEAWVTLEGIFDEKDLERARKWLANTFTKFWKMRAVVFTEQERYEPNATPRRRRRKVPPGGKPWRVELSNAPNMDIPGGYWHGGTPGPSRSVPVASFEEASQVVEDYIREHLLGGGNWTGGAITDYATGKAIGRVSYNGRVWPPGEWHSGQEALWPNNGEDANYEVWQFSGPDGYEEASGLTLTEAIAEAERIHERTGRGVRVFDSDAVQDKYPKMPRPTHAIKAKRKQ